MSSAEAKSAGRGRASGRGAGAIKITRTATIRRPPAEVYGFWRDLENAAAVMPGNVSVAAKSGRISHWTARVPGGRRVEWDAEIVEDKRNRLIAWRSCAGADVANSGSVRFEPGPAGSGSTKVKLALEYTPPGGRIGALVGKATRSRAAEEVGDGLRRVKQRLEAEGGEGGKRAGGER